MVEEYIQLGLWILDGGCKGNQKWKFSSKQVHWPNSSFLLFWWPNLNLQAAGLMSLQRIYLASFKLQACVWAQCLRTNHKQKLHIPDQYQQVDLGLNNGQSHQLTAAVSSCAETSGQFLLRNTECQAKHLILISRPETFLQSQMVHILEAHKK